MYCWGGNLDEQMHPQDNTQNEIYDWYSSPLLFELYPWCYNEWATGCLDGIADSDEKVLRVATGDGFTCATLPAIGKPLGELHCLGDDSLGQLGTAYQQSFSRLDKVFLPDPSIPEWVNINQGEAISPVDFEAGWKNICAILENGSAFCWGDNTLGQVGDGTICEQYNFSNDCVTDWSTAGGYGTSWKGRPFDGNHATGVGHLRH